MDAGRNGMIFAMLTKIQNLVSYSCLCPVIVERERRMTSRNLSQEGINILDSFG